MSYRRSAIVGSVCLLGVLAGCATPSQELGLNAPGTSFYNPYRTAVIDNGPVGPDRCVRAEPSARLEVTEGIVLGTALPLGQGADCAGDSLFYPGAGRFAFDQKGNRVRLSRSELRRFRESRPGVFDQSENDRPTVELPEPVDIPETSMKVDDRDASGAIPANPRELSRGGGSPRQ